MNFLQRRTGTSLVLLLERLADMPNVLMHWDFIRLAIQCFSYIYELLIESYVLSAPNLM